LVVSIVDPSNHPGEPDIAAPDYERYLLEALFTGGAPAGHLRCSLEQLQH